MQKWKEKRPILTYFLPISKTLLLVYVFYKLYIVQAKVLMEDRFDASTLSV